jgi:predicted protein tyrosine phosphatase
VLQAAKKFYDLSTINDEITLQNESSKWVSPNKLALNLTDAFQLEEINQQAIIDGVNFLHTYHKQQEEKVYVHCEMGLSRSPSIVFIYLVQRNILNNDDFQSAFSDFLEYYEYATPNRGMWIFLKTNFPYSHLQ